MAAPDLLGCSRDIPERSGVVVLRRLAIRAVCGVAWPLQNGHDVRVDQLRIVWQRLVVDGATCVRCHATQGEVEHAVSTLRDVLRPLGIEPILEIREIDDAAFRSDPSVSNRIWVNGTPMEDWLHASVGSSECCSVCGDTPCRTVEVDGRTFEAIPERLLVRAALIAAAQMLDAA